MQENVILVNEDDVAVGEMEKLKAHEDGLLHRAFSVFIFNTKGELLLQQRALHKYHSGGKWTNTCCSHPRPNESTADAAARRLKEEMNLSCDLYYEFGFIYKAEFENGLIEHEYDHVYFGTTDMLPLPNVSEVADWKYVQITELDEDIAKNSDDYTPWFKICFRRIRDAQ
jgi:isopentenyl-diphosphate delta-isomerase